MAAKNLVPFKGLPTFEMISKLQDNIHTLNSEIATLVATSHPVAIYLLTQKKSELSALLCKEEAKVKQMRKSYGLDTAYGYLLDTYKESSSAPVSAAAGTVSTVSGAAGTSSDAAAAGGGTSSDAAAGGGTSSDAAGGGTSSDAAAGGGTSSDVAAEGSIVAAAAAEGSIVAAAAAAEGSIVAAAAAEGSIVAADAAEAGGSILAGSARSTRVRWSDLYTTVYNEVVSKMREEDRRPRNIYDAMIATGLVPSVEYIQVVWHHQSIAKKAKKADEAKV